ncbi:FtsX-like permease family protein [Myxococcota bacterium]|nr:FtsX-like permease family protein [Myxococcota bacterium]
MIGHMPLSLLLTLAARSLWAHKVKSLIVGSILFFGTFLVVLGGALLDTVQDTMARSITSSMAGHLQLYSSDAEDELALFGSMAMGAPDYGEIDSFQEQAAPLLQVDNVVDIVPMGLSMATVFGEGEIDRVLEVMRQAELRGDGASVQAAIPQVRRIAASLLEEIETTRGVVADKEKLERDVATLRRVDSDAFWATDYALDPMGSLAMLDAEVAPLAGDGRMMWLRVIGTEPVQFAQRFDRFYVVDGEAIPPGRRGFMFSKRTYEKIVKNKVAVELDEIWEAVTEKGATIAGDPLLQQRIARNSRQYARVTFGLSAADAAAIEADLRAFLPGVSGDLDALVQELLLVDDDNLAARRQFFYDKVAPRIRLYDMPVGSTMALRAYTRSGYVRSINVKVYGTYEFKGLEKSDLASASNLADMVTFRQLYGKMGEEELAELSAIQREVGVQAVSRDDAEAALFGGDEGGLVQEADGTTADPLAIADDSLGNGAGLDDRVYTVQEMRDGLAINAAVILRDPDRLEESKAAIQARIDALGLPLQVVDWRQASGIVGQFLFVVQAVLVISLLIIFLVALLIINNSMVMATLDRTAEIGTMRAIGARRGVVLALFMGETVLLGVASGALGALAAVGLIAWLHQVGIPAFQDVLVLLFAGPRLYPTVGPQQVVFGLVTVTAVGVVSALYPALLASRVQPIVAMRGKE